MTEKQPPLLTQMTIKGNFYLHKWTYVMQTQLTKYGATKSKILKKKPRHVIMGIDALSHTSELHKKSYRSYIILAYANAISPIKHTYLRNPINQLTAHMYS